jgi:hypothetical protein
LTTIATDVEPAIGANGLIADDGRHRGAFDGSGEVLWHQPFHGELATAPVVDRDRLILSTSEGDIIALRVRRRRSGAAIFRAPRAASGADGESAVRRDRRQTGRRVEQR